MKVKTFLLCTGTIALSLGAYSAHAENPLSGPRYTPRAEISQKNYTQTNRMEDRIDNKSYGQYEQREPCQNYRRMPRNYVDNCGNKDIVTAMVEDHAPAERLLPVIRSYTVLFDFDKSAVRPDENETLKKAMQEIKKYHPQQITVTGYTDSSGKMDYNQRLSREREQAVSQALLDRGIVNQRLDRDARGENDQAVQTEDGVKNQQNRRVVIDFRG